MVLLTSSMVRGCDEVPLHTLHFSKEAPRATLQHPYTGYLDHPLTCDPPKKIKSKTVGQKLGYTTLGSSAGGALKSNTPLKKTLDTNASWDSLNQKPRHVGCRIGLMG